MEESGFNDAFGFVEIDADCDLGLMPELEKEFRALRQPGERAGRVRGDHRDGSPHDAMKCLANRPIT